MRIVGPDGLDEAVTLLRAGGIVALPTETVYGLAARADDASAVAAIYRAKGRPDFNPLIVHVVDLAAAGELAEADARFSALATAFWPGPLTIVAPRRHDARLAEAVTAGLSTVALRCPAHPLMRWILGESGLALAAPSANRSGAISPTCADHVAASLGAAVPLIVDGGPCKTGLESTIVALRTDGTWQVLRPGTISRDALAGVLGAVGETTASSEGIEAPGQLASHYAPDKPMRLDAIDAAPDEFLIGFGALGGQCNLSPAGDLAEAAAQLYACLHRANAAPQPRIAVAPLPEAGIGAAIMDRLRRAAT